MKTLGKLILVSALLLWGVNTVRAQGSIKDDKAKKAAEVKKLVNSKDYVFEATHENPQKGEKPLKYHRYDVAFAKDTLIADLPGYANGPVKFDCTKYAYSAVKGKNGAWDITVKPKTNMSDVKQLKLDVYPNGYASLKVVSRDHGPLSFDGYVKQEEY
jgi:hypothetical protein